MKKILLAISAFTVMALGGDYEDGATAYKNQNYKKAVELYRILPPKIPTNSHESVKTGFCKILCSHGIS